MSDLWYDEVEPEVNKRVLYLSGPHGVGKSTLIEDLKGLSGDIIFRPQLGHMELEEQGSRQLWRVALHAIEHRENLEVARLNPGKVVIGDRCMLDDIAYMRAFVNLGWCTQDNFQSHMTLTDTTYETMKMPVPENFIILLPPPEWHVERIVGRWNKGLSIKWHEEDFEYLGAVRDMFERCGQELPENCLLLRETDRRARIQAVTEHLARLWK